MFPDKTRMVKIANLLLLQLAIAPVIFPVVAVLLEMGGASSQQIRGLFFRFSLF